jgi:hypothetical protein
MQQQVEPQEQPEEEVVDDSIVVDMSAAEGVAEGLEEGEVNQPVMEGAALFQQLVGQEQVLQVGMVHIGPMMPPHMILDRLINMALPYSFFTHVPKAISCDHFTSVFVTEQQLFFKGSLSVSLGLHTQVARKHWRLSTARRQVATLTECEEAHVADNAQGSVDTAAIEGKQGADAQETDSLVFCSTPIKSVPQKKRGRPRKSEQAVVDTAYRRSTRSCTKRDGHKPVSMSDTVPRPRKKLKLQRKKVEEEKKDLTRTQDEASNESQKDNSDENTVQLPPETPVHIMQRVGVALGIDADLITEEKLKADSKGKTSSNSSNDS